MSDKGAVTDDTPTGLHCGKFRMGQPLGRLPHEALSHAAHEALSHAAHEALSHVVKFRLADFLQRPREVGPWADRLRGVAGLRRPGPAQQVSELRGTEH